MVVAADRKTIVFPRYEELSKLTDDQFWKDFLLNCAMNKKIRHLSLQENTVITYDIRYKKTVTKLPDDNEDALKLFQQVIKTELELCSTIDAKKQQDIFEIVNKGQKLRFNEWKEITKQRTKDNLLLNYCDRYAEEHKLTEGQRFRHFCLIKYALAFKQLTGKDIIVTDSQVSHISGIIFNEEKGTFSLENDTIIHKNTAWNEKKETNINSKLEVYYKQRKKSIRYE